MHDKKPLNVFASFSGPFERPARRYLEPQTVRIRRAHTQSLVSSRIRLIQALRPKVGHTNNVPMHMV